MLLVSVASKRLLKADGFVRVALHDKGTAGWSSQKSGEAKKVLHIAGVRTRYSNDCDIVTGKSKKATRMYSRSDKYQQRNG